MKILVWRVHRAWTTALVHGAHEYLVPVGQANESDAWDCGGVQGKPSTVTEVLPHQRDRIDADLVILQRPEEIDLVRRLTGRIPGVDLPAIYVEQRLPSAGARRHPMAEQDRIPIVHLTEFNQRQWDTGRAHTLVIEPSVVDPGHGYLGDLPRAAVVMNDPMRRARDLGVDLLHGFAAQAPIDVFGRNVGALGEQYPRADLTTFEDHPQQAMHSAIARRRLYLHPVRWTTLDSCLLEAMHLGMPIVALAATQAPHAIPSDAGVVSVDMERLYRAVRDFVHDPAYARQAGDNARSAALGRFGLDRFLAEWDRVMSEVAGGGV